LGPSHAIAEWRSLLDRKMQADRWQSPTELMPKLMRRLGLRKRLRETEAIDAWSKIVGDFIARTSLRWHYAKGFRMSVCFNPRCTTSSNKSPSPKSFEN
jgi:hypothetical protein